jgi:membrane protease YdiL (CAAX protease family)
MIVSGAAYEWSKAPSADDSITPVLLLLVFIALPILSARTYYYLKSGKELPPKNKRFRAVLVGHFLMLLPATASASQQSLDLWRLRFPTPQQWLVGALILGAFYLWLSYSWHRWRQESLNRARLFLPETTSQLAYWLAVSLSAGIVEEYVYRGVVYAAILSLTSKPYSAALISAAAFGAAHLHAGVRNGIWTSLVGLMLQVLVFWTGALYLSMAVHAIYDLLVGMLAVLLLAKESRKDSAITQPAS